MRVGREDNHAKSASARVLRGRSAGSPRGESRAGRAAQELNAVVIIFRSRSCRPGALLVRRSLSQRRGDERVTRRLQRQPRQFRQCARAPWTVGRFYTGRSARGQRAMGFNRGDHEALKPQLPILRRVGEERPRPMTWGGARRALATKITSPSPTASGSSVGRWPVVQGAMRAWAARRGTQRRWRRRFEAAAADLARCRCGRALANCVGWSALRVGREDNHATSASARKRVARWPQRQPRQVRQRACAPWAVGRFSTGRTTRGSRATGVRRGGHDAPKSQPPTWRDVGEEKLRLAA